MDGYLCSNMLYQFFAMETGWTEKPLERTSAMSDLVSARGNDDGQVDRTICAPAVSAKPRSRCS